MSYNLLPENVKLLYEIKYGGILKNHIVIFKNKSQKWGALLHQPFDLPEFKLIVEPIYESTSFNSKINLIEAVNYLNGKWEFNHINYNFFDTAGNLKGRVEDITSLRTDDLGSIFIEKFEKIGLLDNDFKILIDPIYNELLAIEQGIFNARKNDNWGIIDRYENILLDFSYHKIFYYSKNRKVIIQDKEKRYFIFDLITLQKTKLNYDKILECSSNTYKAPSEASYPYCKTITHLERTEFDDYEMSKYIGQWGIIGADAEMIIPNEYAYIDFLRNPNYYKVAKGEFQFENEYVVDDKLIAKNIKWGIIDAANNIIVPIKYDWVEEVEETIWVVNEGGIVYYYIEDYNDYWAVEGGKRGVYNGEKLIVPIEYDQVYYNWGKVKDFIFVKKGKINFYENNDYDVYDFDGLKITKNKPLPKDHQYPG